MASPLTVGRRRGARRKLGSSLPSDACLQRSQTNTVRSVTPGRSHAYRQNHHPLLLDNIARAPIIIRRISIGCLYPVTQFGSGQHRQETQHGLWRRAWGASVMAFWVDATGRAPGSGRVRKTVASGRHAGYPTGMTAKTTRRDGDSLAGLDVHVARGRARDAQGR